MWMFIRTGQALDYGGYLLWVGVTPQPHCIEVGQDLVERQVQAVTVFAEGIDDKQPRMDRVIRSAGWRPRLRELLKQRPGRIDDDEHEEAECG